MLLPILLLLAAAPPGESAIDALDLTQKLKGPNEEGVPFVHDGTKIIAPDSKGNKWRLVPTSTKKRLSSKELRARIQNDMKGLLPSDYTDDDPNEGSSITRYFEVPVPKKVTVWQSYYDPTTDRQGKKPPKSVDRTDKQSTVQNQGARGTCTAHAMTAALETNHFRHLSREFAYWLLLGKDMKKVCEDPGANIDDIYDVAANNSLPLETDKEYNMLFCPLTEPNADMKAAAVYKPRRVYDIPVDPAISTGDGSLRTMTAAANDPRFLEAALASGYDVVMTLNYPTQPGLQDDLATGEPLDVKLNSKGKPYKTDGGHAMLAVGYERDSKHKKIGGGYVLFKNSYGPDFGNKGYVKVSYDFVRLFTAGAVIMAGTGNKMKIKDGGVCSDNTQCESFKAGVDGSGLCCDRKDGQGVCTLTQKDHAGVWYCPSECVGRAGASPGTCDELSGDGDACKANADCEEFSAIGQPGSQCCDGVCRETRADFTGVYYCPSECRANAGAAAGTCKESKDDGASCQKHSDCKGFNGALKKGVGCCNGKCQDMKKDFANLYYCKDECRGASGASLGTCPLKGKNKSCSADADCANGRSCCGGKCKKKKKDWAGVMYCPAQCVGSAGGKAGSCN